MQNGARFQAILELITQIFTDKQPADKVLNEYLRARKYIGSKDRRFISDWVWKIIRNRLKLSFDAQSQEPRKILLQATKDCLAEVFDDSKYGLSPLTEDEKIWLQNDNTDPYPPYVEAECPQWLFAKIKDMALCKALNQSAAADFRANFISREDAINRLAKEGITASAMPYSPMGLRVAERFSLGNCMAYQEGLIEVQDEASQLAALLCDVSPQDKIMDYCCGAGGKSLALAHLLRNQGHILAHDINAKRLEAIKPRMQRLGVKNIETVEIVATTDRDFTRFIIDAPCSGTGTWRRAPDAKFRLNAAMLRELTQTQSLLLDIGAEKTQSGGRLIYITCSVLADEDEEIIDGFLARNPDFKPVDMRQLWEAKIGSPYPYKTEKYLKMSPLTTNTDGFFIAVLEKQGK